MRNGPSRLDVFPAFHKVAGRRVLVVGGGEEAAAKVRLVGESSAEILVVAEEVEISLTEAIAATGARLAARAFEADDLEGAVLVFAATGEEEQDRAVVEAARARGVPANAVDRPDLCDFYTPALVNRAPLAIAITTTGAAPIIARRLRARLEAMLPGDYGSFIAFADGLRARVREALGNGEDRRRFWASFFDSTAAALFFSGDRRRAAAEAERLIEKASRPAEGFVALVGAGPGAEDLLTLRAQRHLQEADIVFYDALVPQAVVSQGRRDAERVAVGKRKGCHSKSQDEINRLLVAAAREGKKVVRLKAGDPMVFGRAGEELAALRAAGIAHEVVPGVTAGLAAAADLQLPLTLRGTASSLVFTTGHDMKGETLPDWARLAAGGLTLSVYMGRSVAAGVAGRLVEAGLAADTPVAVVENASRADKRMFVGTLADLPALEHRSDITGPTLVVIGEAVAAASLAEAEPLHVSEKTVSERLAA
ncbi:siroheme synthase CysG [Afifella sp. IM 167]|uniref:siroheme synthase CysG n=1 Tax=Afifella sp. IM 167 TaxID=2033586 RepID=UPI001CCE08E0|nr:siroheme synthase CysG [Afifella sp. IM 167]MBZ8134996.1 uroporphyrinogen-III C-methyltransferase [Afifella sp. IM 167]